MQVRPVSPHVPQERESRSKKRQYGVHKDADKDKDIAKIGIVIVILVEQEAKRRKRWSEGSLFPPPPCSAAASLNPKKIQRRGERKWGRMSWTLRKDLLPYLPTTRQVRFQQSKHGYMHIWGGMDVQVYWKDCTGKRKRKVEEDVERRRREEKAEEERRIQVRIILSTSILTSSLQEVLEALAREEEEAERRRKEEPALALLAMRSSWSEDKTVVEEQMEDTFDMKEDGGSKISRRIEESLRRWEEEGVRKCEEEVHRRRGNGTVPRKEDEVCQQQQQQQQREIRNRREHHCHHDGTVRKRRPRRRKKRSTAGRDGNGKPSGAEEGAVERAEHGHDDAERHQESRRTQHPLAPQLGRGQGTASAMALARGNLRPDRANSARPHPTNRPIYRFSIVSRLRFGLRVHLEPVIFGRKEKKEKTTLPDWLPVLAWPIRDRILVQETKTAAPDWLLVLVWPIKRPSFISWKRPCPRPSCKIQS